LSTRRGAVHSVVNFISYELIAAILWKIEKFNIGIGYESLMEEASKIFEVEFTSKGSKLYRWTHISKDSENCILKMIWNFIDMQCHVKIVPAN
jgi:hypothetical protein